MQFNDHISRGLICIDRVFVYKTRKDTPQFRFDRQSCRRSFFSFAKYVRHRTTRVRLTRQFTVQWHYREELSHFRICSGRCAQCSPSASSLSAKIPRYFNRARSTAANLSRPIMQARSRIIGDATLRGLCRQFISQRACIDLRGGGRLSHL